MIWMILSMLLLLGIALVLVEIFLIPGIGAVGVTGIVSIALSIFLSFRQLEAREALYFTFGAVNLSIFVIVIALRIASKAGILKPFILRTKQEGEKGYRSAPPQLEELVGKEGVAVTPLRPAGVVEIGDRRIDVVSEGDFIERDSPVTVTQVKGRRVVVSKK